MTWKESYPSRITHQLGGQRLGMVSPRIQSSTTRGTHFLDMEVRISPETISLSSMLTPWRGRRSRLVKAREEIEQSKGLTSWRGHRSESGLIRTQKKNREDEWHPLSIEGRGRDSSSYLNNASQRRYLQPRESTMRIAGELTISK